LDRSLEKPGPNDDSVAVTVAETFRPAIKAVILAYANTETNSRLLLTSRYDIRLPDENEDSDLAIDLVRVRLAPMQPRERARQLRALERLAGRETGRIDAVEEDLLAHALEVASGNPLLQSILTYPVIQGNYDTAREIMERLQSFRTNGALPAPTYTSCAAQQFEHTPDSLSAFLERLSLENYRMALTADQKRQLAAAALFAEEVPVPRPALEAAAAALGVEDTAAAIERLSALGLLDHYSDASGGTSFSINPLARLIADRVGSDDTSRVAKIALKQLLGAWGPDMSAVQTAEYLRLTEIQHSPMLSESKELRVDGTYMRSALRTTLAHEEQKYVDLLFKVPSSDVPAPVFLLKPTEGSAN
jgi:hypothetical protein